MIWKKIYQIARQVLLTLLGASQTQLLINQLVWLTFWHWLQILYDGAPQLRQIFRPLARTIQTRQVSVDKMNREPMSGMAKNNSDHKLLRRGAGEVFGRAALRGFTLIEYIVVLSLSVLLVAIAVPNLVSLDASFRRSQALMQIKGDLIYARSLALKDGARAAILLSDDGSSYSISTGHAPYTDFPGTDTQAASKSLPSGIAVRSSQPIVFDPQGHLIDSTGAMSKLTVILSWKKKDYEVLSICPMGFAL